ncbi:MAG TPA: hypothetical protein VK506_08650 [Conexibacter sp.]|nr:hypothetical protein [Conexibacter sp.]
MYKVRLLAAQAAAFAVLAVVASSAGAVTTEVDPAGRISAPSSGTVRFEGAGISVQCNLTLTGSLAASFTLAPGAHVGSITAASISGCSGGSVTAVLGLPWALDHTDVLPGDHHDFEDRGNDRRDFTDLHRDNLTGVLFDLDGAAFNLNSLGLNCLYRGDLGTLLTLVDTGTNTYRTGAIATLATSIPLASGGFLCPRSGTVSGTFSLSPSQSILVT